MTDQERSLSRLAWVAALSVALITLLVYIPALHNDFVNWDDPDYIQDNIHIRNIDLRFIGWMVTTFHVSNWHPMTWLSHAVDYALWGLDPMGHHLTNIILHSINTFLVVLLIAGLVRKARIRHSGADRHDTASSSIPLSAGLISGLLFGLHPLHVESVAWISERKDVLYGFFYLSSLLLYLRYIVMEDKRRTRYYALCLLSFALSILSKPMAVTLPVILIILDIYPFERLRSISAFGKVLLEKVPFVALSVASAAVTMYAHRLHEALPPSEIYPLASRLMLAVRAYAFYIVKMVLPFRLAHLYPYPEAMSFTSFEFYGSVLLLVGITSICLYMMLRKRSHVWITSWAYYAVTLFPVIGVMQIGKHAAADRYTYLPGLGPFVLVALGVTLTWKKFGFFDRTPLTKKLYVLLPAMFIMVLMAILTIQQIGMWQNSIVLWSRQISLFPDYYYAYYCRGTSHDERGQYAQAIRDYKEALRLNPSYARAYNNLGITYKRVNKYEQALESYNKAIELDPEYAGTYHNLANLYLAMNKPQLAIENFNRAIERDTSLTVAFKNRGDVLLAMGMYDRAVLDFNRVLEMEPGDTEMYSKRGIAYFQMKDIEQAIKDFLFILKIEPLNYRAYTNLGIIYAESGEFQQAIASFSKALEINPQERSIYFNRGLTYKKLDKRQEMIRDFQTAARMGDAGAQDYLKAEGILW